MLKFLSIRDFVIVSQLDVEFGSGFTALTGETGAGKSILIDALLMTLGERGYAGMVRKDCARAEITAEFDIRRLAALQDWLKARSLNTDEGVCLMRRQLEADGRTRGFINGRSVTLQQMREAGEYLLNIHGQHAHQSLSQVQSQRALLDDYAELSVAVAKVAASFHEWQALNNRRISLSANSEAIAAERELLAFECAELESLAFNEAQWVALQADHARISHAASLQDAAAFGIDTLGDADHACLTQLDALMLRLRDVMVHDPRLGESLGLLESARADLQEVVHSLRHYQQHLDVDPRQQAEMESRIQAVMDMARKYRVVPERLNEVLRQVAARLSVLGHEFDLAELVRQEEAARQRYLEGAQQLSRSRQLAADRLAQEVSASMQNLAMPGGRFFVALSPLENGNEHGLDAIEFQVSTNADLPLRSLIRVASGGELSRISLAIQVATCRVASVPTLIFDEVDSGIGGGVAEIVGQLLSQLGRDYQVLCVTHLPQVAAKADQHWLVGKTLQDGVTSSHIKVLSGELRVAEIARMLGGVTVTDATRLCAGEMLGVSA
ncbi:MAG: DNA repair protein RecN [Gallionella sp.]|nr:DNA repair protein RecN [Gallionella sp.]